MIEIPAEPTELGSAGADSTGISVSMEMDFSLSELEAASPKAAEEEEGATQAAEGGGGGAQAIFISFIIIFLGAAAEDIFAAKKKLNQLAQGGFAKQHNFCGLGVIY